MITAHKAELGLFNARPQRARRQCGPHRLCLRLAIARPNRAHIGRGTLGSPSVPTKLPAIAGAKTIQGPPTNAPRGRGRGAGVCEGASRANGSCVRLLALGFPRSRRGAFATALYVAPNRGARVLIWSPPGRVVGRRSVSRGFFGAPGGRHRKLVS